MLIAVTTTGKIVLAVAAGLFIVFAIASSFYFPRRDPDFPGNRLGSFVALTVLLFIVLIGAMVAFAGESEEGSDATESTSTQAVTETTGTDTDETETETEGDGAAEGDAAAGESIYAENGCGSCHTLVAAGTSGSIGPNLDDSQPDAELVVDRVTNGSGAMPAFGDSLDEQQIQDVAAYVVESTQ